MSGVQKIILKRLEEERDEELPTVDWFVVKPGLSMTIFVVYLFGIMGPVSQLVRGSKSCSYTTDMCVEFEGCLFFHDDDVEVVAKFKMLLQIFLCHSELFIRIEQ